MIDHLIIPASFRATEFLPGDLALRKHHAIWLVGTILRKTANKDFDLWGLVRLKHDILRRVIGSDYRRIVKALADGGAIEVLPRLTGQLAQGFRIGKRYISDDFVPVLLDEELLALVYREPKRNTW